MRRAWRWYDDLREPWRLLLCVAAVMVGIVPLATRALGVQVAGACWLLALVAWRTWYLQTGR